MTTSTAYNTGTTVYMGVYASVKKSPDENQSQSSVSAHKRCMTPLTVHDAALALKFDMHKAHGKAHPHFSHPNVAGCTGDQERKAVV